MGTFGKRLKEARKLRGFSQERLGIEAGIEPATASARMSQYEKGVHQPSESIVKQIAAVMNLPVPYFYCEDDETAHLLQCFHLLQAKDRKDVVDQVENLAFKH
jgi:transcriptional regulator with XRE-family HTH domain